MTPDACPHCRNRLDIVCVKFGLRGVTAVFACPNCAIVAADHRREDFAGSALAGAWRGAFRRIEALSSRYRYITRFLLAAVVLAAVLRHGVHVYGGIAREDIRWGALLALFLMISCLAIFWVRWRVRQGEIPGQIARKMLVHGSGRVLRKGSIGRP
ncbi:MAG: hypothetical protein JOY90_13365 [Bradyrhizobium sp.]|uniref:hypothetical protein n=1 Tax=Bradyrhizobium sp. TaxID=376 RepID=UPI001E0D199B|nr:hypothetical protein [Bradyrhizobium sp.]MBV9561418.1 hypothetical protein [Bradyrhizobium sp.]